MARLSKSVKPTHYELDLNLDLDGLTFQGSVVADLEIVEETTSIVLHSKDLEITSTKIVHVSGETTAVPEVKADENTQTITIALGKPLTAGDKIQLCQSFNGSIKQNGTCPGFQWTEYKATDGETKRCFSTSCEPIGARTIFPCLDEPEFKATISSTVTMNREEMTCVSNMDVASSGVTTSGKKVTKRVAFNKTPPMSTYLICFVIGDLDFIESTQLKFPVRVYGVKGAKLENGASMLDVAVRALDLYQNLFELDYPLPKLDLVALPDAGGLENWGCIVFGERFVLLDAETTATKSRQMAAETLCHEISHQWFGNLVTMAWWDDLWLNEAFAEWAGFYAVDKLFPEWKYWLHFVAGDPDPEAMAFYQGALDLDSTRASHPIYNPNASPDRMHELFTNITYMKGATLVRMLSQLLGIDTFIDGVKDYLKRHVYANATNSDLWDTLGASSGKDVRALMHEWTRHIGYPLIEVSENEEAGTITLEQHRYLQSATCKPEEDENLYRVPLNMKTTVAVAEARQGDFDFLMLTERNKTFPTDLGFYKLNSGQIGLYRVSYPPSRLQIFGKQVSQGGILSAEDRVGLISDLHALVSSSLGTPTNTAHLLNFLLNFVNENDFLVWRQIFYTFAKIRQAFLFASPQTDDALQLFHRHLISAHCAKANWRVKTSDSVPDQIATALLFSQVVGYEDLNGVASELFDEFMAGNKSAINPNMRKYVLQAVAKSKDADRYETIVKLARETPDPELRTDAFVALGYAEDPERVKRVLVFMTAENEPFSPLEKWFLLNALQTHRTGAEASWAWLRDMWGKFGFSGVVSVGRYISSCTGSLSTAAQLKELQEFALNVKDKFKPAFGQAEAGTKARMSWIERDGEGVESWLLQHGFCSRKKSETVGS